MYDEFIISLLTSNYSDTRSFVHNLLTYTILPDNRVKILIGRIISNLLILGVEDVEKAKDIADVLFKSFSYQLRGIGLDIVRDLLNHQLGEVQELGGQLLINHEKKPEDLPEELLQSLIKSSHEAVRGLGVRLIGMLPDETVMLRIPLIISLCTHELSDLRKSVRVVIKRLGNLNKTFGEHVTSELIEILYCKEEYEGVHSNIVDILWEDLNERLEIITKDSALKLVKSRSEYAQDLGGNWYYAIG